jgi:phosphoribosylaminoimidazole-succinocarboxamide synthase
MCDRIGKEAATRLRDLTLQIYRKAHDFALQRGVLIADTKFEFGVVDGNITLVDEALTPDSSRFWPASEYRAGANPPSYDKQFVRDWLESVKWDKRPPAPRLPDEVVQKTAEKYREAYRRITGSELK